MNEAKLAIAKRRICLALDVDDPKRAISLVNLLRNEVGLFKIGSELYAVAGSKIVEDIVHIGVPVFLDLKFHDIPNTVSRVSRVVTRLGVTMFNVHAAGGSDMIKAAVEASKDEAVRQNCPSPLVIAVTVLTSINDNTLQGELLVNSTSEKYVQNLAVLAQKNGANGVVASPKEVEVIRESCGEDFKIITPGVRPSGFSAGDQKRFTTPSEAIRRGSDIVVIGRPILEALDPVNAALEIAKAISAIEQ